MGLPAVIDDEPDQAANWRDAPTSSAAERQRRYRARKRAGRVVLHIEVEDVDASEAMVSAGFLAPGDVDDPAALARALERALIDVLRRARDA